MGRERGGDKGGEGKLSATKATLNDHTKCSYTMRNIVFHFFIVFNLIGLMEKANGSAVFDIDLRTAGGN